MWLLERCLPHFRPLRGPIRVEERVSIGRFTKWNQILLQLADYSSSLYRRRVLGRKRHFDDHAPRRELEERVREGRVDRENWRVGLNTNTCRRRHRCCYKLLVLSHRIIMHIVYVTHTLSLLYEFQSATTPSALLFSPSCPTSPRFVDDDCCAAFNFVFIFCDLTPRLSLCFCLASAALNICSLRAAMTSGAS